MEKGIKQGIEKGMKKGLEKGKRSIALKLKKMGLGMEQISEATGLSPEEIEAME